MPACTYLHKSNVHAIPKEQRSVSVPLPLPLPLPRFPFPLPRTLAERTNTARPNQHSKILMDRIIH